MKDNLMENGISDFIVEGTNVSEILRANKNKKVVKKQSLLNWIIKERVFVSVCMLFTIMVIIGTLITRI